MKIKKDKSAVASQVLGILSVFLWEFSIFPILAIVFGIIGIVNTNKNKTDGVGLAITGLVLGIIFLIVRIASQSNSL